MCDGNKRTSRAQQTQRCLGDQPGVAHMFQRHEATDQVKRSGLEVTFLKNAFTYPAAAVFRCGADGCRRRLHPHQFGESLLLQAIQKNAGTGSNFQYAVTLS